VTPELLVDDVDHHATRAAAVATSRMPSSFDEFATACNEQLAVRHAQFAGRLSGELTRVLAATTFTSEEGVVTQHCWLGDAGDAVALVRIDSSGYVHVAPAALVDERRATLAHSLLRVAPDLDEQQLLSAEELTLSLEVELDDESLLDLLVEMVSDAVGNEPRDTADEPSPEPDPVGRAPHSVPQGLVPLESPVATAGRHPGGRLARIARGSTEAASDATGSRLVPVQR
jgi:hypothetical protein